VRENKTGRAIALKVLKPEGARHAPTRKAFISEARLLESLEHPGLVRGFGVAKSGTTYFNRLELIEGRTLLEYLDEGQAFEESVALRIILETAEVLKYLYSKEVIHRDIKPGNIMLTQNGAVKLIDLGFAAEGGQATNPEDTAVGTVAYLSPEQARGGATADLRSDVYSLGATLFQLVVGRLPFEGSDDEDTLRMQVMESLSSPELKSRGFTPHLSYFIEKMMAKELEIRYQTWDALIDDIKEQLEGFESLDYARDVKTRRGRSTRGPRGRR
jgi:serine/threonine-protein kinase